MSGTSTFQPPIADLMIDIAERIGLDPAALTTQHYLSFRRSMNLVQSRMSNRGVNLWSVDLISTTLVQGTAQYSVAATTVDILDVYRSITVGGEPVNTLMYPLSRNDFAGISNPTTQGPSTAYWFDRSPSSGVMHINLWPTPDGNGPYTMLYYATQRIQDATPESGGNVDMPFRFYYAWVAEVAADCSVKFAPARTQVLAAIAKDAWDEAAQEDTEKVPFYCAPDFSSYFT